MRREAGEKPSRDDDKHEDDTIRQHQPSYDMSNFDHEFSGMSVWLEPEPNAAMDRKMGFLQQCCGGDECGVSSFDPHVTLLYNIHNSRFQDGDPQATLRKCWELFQSKQENHLLHDATISASDWYYLHYPKSADDGKGFGCSISLLLMEKSRWLEDLQQACVNAFGQGERKGFIPHLSMVYAPEDAEPFLVKYTGEERKIKTFLKEPMPLKYLSLWSTQGRISEWYPILKIPMTKAVS
jgi:2'-5' RNA ligase